VSQAGPASHLILFDCDGTLTDSHGAIVAAMQRAFAECGLEVPADEAVKGVIGLSLMAAVAKLSSDPGMNERLASCYRDHYVASESSLRLYPGVVETLRQLQQRGYLMGIVTGKSKPGLLRVLDQFDLGSFFSVLRTADCTLSKPHPAMALECMQELGIPASRTSLVGDALFDMQMAVAAEIRPYGVSFGVESADALYVAGAYNVVEEFPALLEHFPFLNSGALQVTIGSTGVI